MTDLVTVRGYVATKPEINYLPSGIPATSFRVASTPRWFDSASNMWKEGSTSWYTVRTFRALAQHVARGVFVGQPLIVTGRLSIKQWETEDGRRGTSAEIDASSVGHDMNYGVSTWTRAIKPSEQDNQNQQQGATALQTEQQAPQDSGWQKVEDHANSAYSAGSSVSAAPSFTESGPAQGQEGQENGVVEDSADPETGELVSAGAEAEDGNPF